MELLSEQRASRSTAATPAVECFHCGTPCVADAFRKEEKHFCCHGCLTVFEILNENGLTDFYKLSSNAGVRVAPVQQNQFAYLDEPAVRERIVNFSNGKLTRVTFRIPAVHCIACVWLLENLFRLKPGIGESQVNFPRKEVIVSFENEKVQLSEVVSLLALLGYEPDLKLSDLEAPKNKISRRLWLQLGVAGFAFGNIMLFSISSYLGLDVEYFKKLFGYLSFTLALPVIFYSASDYWKSSWRSLCRRMVTIEVPIAVGIAAIFGQSTFEVFSGRGDGYFDSLCGLIFFLLCGRLFQQKTFDRLAFDRDYRSFFPLSVTRKMKGAEESISLSQLQVGDRLVIRNGELIPADAKLCSGSALIDYSFVTGESDPVAKNISDHLYAGGRQIGGAIEIQTAKAVSQSYLTSLWNQDAFKKEKSKAIHTLINVYSSRFSKIILFVASAVGLFWWFTDPSVAVKAFTSVLIVACPCAVVLGPPFALGTAQRVLGKRNVFLKNPAVVEVLAKVDAVVFDKTGTLTVAGGGSICFDGDLLLKNERVCLAALTKNSTHPLSARITEVLGESHATVRSFRETPGCGVQGLAGGTEILLGSAAWLQANGIVVAHSPTEIGSSVHVAMNGKYRGCFVLTSAIRPQTEAMIRTLGAQCELALLSGDNEREREEFAEFFGRKAHLEFNQSPQKKFDFVEQLHERGKTVMMVGDGLNDAGALKNADVGVAVVENISAFSPASDVIMSASMIPRLNEILHFSRSAVRVVRASFVISSVYNIIGISIAASGKLAPVVCAILMPLSSITVVAFAFGVTTWLGRRTIKSDFPEVTSSQSQLANSKPKISPDLLPAGPKIKEAA